MKNRVNRLARQLLAGWDGSGIEELRTIEEGTQLIGRPLPWKRSLSLDLIKMHPLSWGGGDHATGDLQYVAPLPNGSKYIVSVIREEHETYYQEEPVYSYSFDPHLKFAETFKGKGKNKMKVQRLRDYEHFTHTDTLEESLATCEKHAKEEGYL